MSRKDKSKQQMYDTEEILGVLQRVAEGYAKNSDEYKALEIAAHGLLCLRNVKVQKDFEEYLGNVGKDLSAKQKEHLKRMGIL